MIINKNIFDCVHFIISNTSCVHHVRKSTKYFHAMSSICDTEKGITQYNNIYKHIFSLSKLRNEIKKPFVTIEVRDSKIIQIAGKMNHAPSEKALDLIREWSNENNLNINC